MRPFSVLTAVFLLFSSSSGRAASYVVTSTADAGAGSLRQAILAANATAVADEISFSGAAFSSHQTIALSSGELAITRGLTITAPVGGLTIDAGGASRVLSVTTPGGDPVILENLRLIGGGGVSAGAGLRVVGAAVLKMSRCMVADCEATGDGGGIQLVNTEAFLFDCTIRGNRCGDDGGGVFATGVGSDVLIAQCTITGNVADDHGGAIYNSGGPLHLLNATVTDNDSDQDANDTGSGALHSHASGTFTLENCIVAGNRDHSPTLDYPDVAKIFAIARHNVIGNGDGSASFSDGVDGNLVGSGTTPLDAGLCPLVFDGPLVAAYPLAAESPARDAADSSAVSAALAIFPPFDQLGQARLINGALDIGATEYQSAAPSGGTVNAIAKSVYSANAGWISFRDTAVTPAQGVIFGEAFLSGKGYAANFGWIDFGDGSPDDGIAYSNTSATDYGVNHDGVGDLSGHAYGANVGYINFGWAAPSDPQRARLDLTTGELLGYAYGANVGWIDLAADGLLVDFLHCIDSDNDGIADAWEHRHFGGLGVATAATDSDGDGKSDRDEHLADTDPNDEGSYLSSRFAGMNASKTAALVQFSSAPARRYHIEVSDALGIAPDYWRDSGLGLIEPDSGNLTSRMVTLPGGARFFLRVTPEKPLQ